ncbi:MAG: DUF3501 family protein [Haliea sp.]|uniref:DUF3501 family protein n=1 Tax=Haliea sp. TaxID=1932666 RepID=UPI0032EE243B
MTQLSRADLWSLEEYAEERPRFRAQVMAHKKTRQLALGEHARLYFEDALTIKYQIQEMLRIEKVFEAAGIAEELDAYNPLIPDGHNWKATFMIEYADPAERAERLGQMIGLEDKVWLQVGNCERVYPIADEDLERSNETKTSSVHFMRFELTPDMITAARNGEAIHAGIDHPAYPIEKFEIDHAIRDSLTADLEPSQVH